MGKYTRIDGYDLLKNNRDEENLDDESYYEIVDLSNDINDLNDRNILKTENKNEITDDGQDVKTNSQNEEESVKIHIRSSHRRGGKNEGFWWNDAIKNEDELKKIMVSKILLNDNDERLVGRVYFNYGSFLDISKSCVEVEKYLLLNKTDSEKKEYAKIIMCISDLINRIPEKKRDTAVFCIMGYADSTLYNGKVEISDRSNRFNTDLSKKRADSVKLILTGRDFNISKDRIYTYGFGYSKNINETTDLERFRRVDIVVKY